MLPALTRLRPPRALPRARGFAWPPFLAYLAVIAVVALVPVMTRKPVLLDLWILVFLAVAQGAAWNVIGGYTGQYSVGHAAYFGMGAYTTMMLLELAQIPPWWGIGLAIINALILSVIIGSITFRLRGPYFVLASIAVAEIIRLAALHWKEFTKGAEGILLTGIPPLVLSESLTIRFVGKQPFFYVALALAVIVVSVNWLVQHSKLGYYFQAIREDQDAAHSLGINLTVYKSLALAISAAFTAAAGGVWALYVKFIDPNLAFSLGDVSVWMVLICIIGGIGTTVGPVIGGIVLVLLDRTLRNPKWLVALGVLGEDSGVVSFIERYFGNAHQLVYGVLVVLVILFAPEGILGLLRTGWGRLRKRLAPAPAATQEPTP